MSSSPTPPDSRHDSGVSHRPAMRSRQLLLIVSTAALLGVLVWVGIAQFGTNARPDGAASLKVQLRDSHETVYVIHQDSGEYIFRVTRLTGPPMDLTPEQFASRTIQDQQSHGLFSRLLNITSPMGMIWVGVGLLGQVLFTGRMIVQWLASEKKHESVVPTAFWWMSLIGATMLLVYFVWRKDAVGVLGQSAGWFIYVRNLWLIYEGSPRTSDNTDTTPQTTPQTPSPAIAQAAPGVPASPASPASPAAPAAEGE